VHLGDPVLEGCPFDFILDLAIDIRNYPSEFVVFALGSLLVHEHTPFASFTNPGGFHFGDTIGLDPGTTHYDGKVVILVDELSVSQAVNANNARCYAMPDLGWRSSVFAKLTRRKSEASNRSHH
jgi:hypothetical protein